MIRLIDDFNKYKQPELASPTSTALQLLGSSLNIKTQPTGPKRLNMLAINKITAAKLIVLWNIPALFLFLGTYEVGTTLLA